MPRKKKTEPKQTLPGPLTAELAALEKAIGQRAAAGVRFAGSLLLVAGSNPSDTYTRVMPFIQVPVKGKEDLPAFYAVACISRDLILALLSLNQNFGLGLDHSLDLLAMTHPMVQAALANGTVETDGVNAGAEPKRVVRDVVEVGAKGAGGGA